MAFPFTLGVASGAPRPTSVVLWTRLAPEPLDTAATGRRPIRVRWEVATDERFRRVVRRGTAEAVAADAHSVHVVADRLEPGRPLWYRFMAQGEVSPVGRTWTAPAPDALPQRLLLAVGSCQHFERGYYAAHRHIVADGVDLMVFVGDYVYEGAGERGRVRRHVGGEARTLDQYRRRHAQYRTDPDLQRLHAAVPWLVTADDHEVDNDYAGLEPWRPDPRFRARRAAAYRAYFEHLPLHPAARPSNGAMRLHARYDFGRLARLHLLDGRQHRSAQACKPARRVGPECRERRREDRTMLGAAQERWLQENLAGAPERWNLIAQATLMARAPRITAGVPRYATDAWDGYPAARRRLLDAVLEAGARSTVVLSGDAHRCFVSRIERDVDGIRTVVAAELCGSSLTSGNPSHRATARTVRDNPHILFGDSRHRGYLLVDVTADACIADVRALEDVTDRASGVSTLARFRIEAGRPGVARVPL